MDEACFCRLLDAVTAGVRLVFRKELINADRYLSPIHFYAEMFVELTVIGRFTDIEQILVIQFHIIQLFTHGSVTSSKSSWSSSSSWLMNCR